MRQDKALAEETEHWRLAMDKELRAENSWLALAGLIWLEKPRTTLGGGGEYDITLEAFDTTVGEFLLQHNQVDFMANTESGVHIDGESYERVRLKADTSGAPTIITVAHYTLMVIERGERLGIRLWDNNRPQRTTFPGRDWFAIGAEYRLMADFERNDPARSLHIPNELGEVELESSPGFVTFELHGRPLRLDALEGPDDGLFLLFKDKTSGQETYGSGRFIKTPSPEDGRVALDFNRAYNPPCAFTKYATCPLPPKQNELPVAIYAGERKPARVA
jgi:uncharacterized protein (DUF1684 family)